MLSMDRSKHKFLFVICIFILFFSYHAEAQVLWKKSRVVEIKSDLNKERLASYYQLIEDAKDCLLLPVRTVMDKPFTPSSGDKHDYMSLSTFFWPDSTKTDGLPYIYKDGLENPEIKQYDIAALYEMSDAVNVMTLAWVLSGNEAFAEKSLEHIRAWFLNEKTRMNPNMEYAQIVKGLRGGKGNSFGLLEGYAFVRMIDALIWLEQYDGLSNNEIKGLKEWFRQYLSWLLNDELGIQEARATNNHGTAYDGQILAFSYYVGDEYVSKRTVNDFYWRRIRRTIDLHGKQPNELSRTNSYTYSVLNISFINDFLIMANNMGYWGTRKSVRKLERAIDYLIYYLNKSKSDWPYQQIIGWSYDKSVLFREMYRFAKCLDHTTNYISIIQEYSGIKYYDRVKLIY